MANTFLMSFIWQTPISFAMRQSVWSPRPSWSSSPGEPVAPWPRASSQASIFVGVGLLGRATALGVGLSGLGERAGARECRGSGPGSACRSRSCSQWFVCSGVGASGRATCWRGELWSPSAARLLCALRHIAMASSISEAGAWAAGTQGAARPREDDGRGVPRAWSREDEEDLGREWPWLARGASTGACPSTDSRPLLDSQRPGRASPWGPGPAGDGSCRRASSALSSSDMRAPTLPEAGLVPREPGRPAELVRFRRAPSPPLFMQGVVGRGGRGSGLSGAPMAGSALGSGRLRSTATPRYMQGVVGRGGKGSGPPSASPSAFPASPTGACRLAMACRPERSSDSVRT
mmetsp:Transcript_20613/g.59709  ORF Transcript_20613/g.59709 Transcript_20613/m.59709 type:complete len:348 (-) Transcript_20613:316-1359(-)